MNETFLAILILSVYFSPVFYQLFIVIKESKRGNKLPLKKFLKYLKYSIYILLPIVGGFALISHTNYFNYESPITYDKIENITFKNFRGIELFKKSLYGNERFAYIVTTIDSEFRNDTLILQSHFHPSRSFVYNERTNSQELLKHELYHFKISELFTRKAKKEISNLKNPTKEKIKKLLKQKEAEEKAYQKEYDYNTFHSYVMSEQKKYEHTVDSLLNLLSIYKNPKIVINENH